jgi:hypothetical protein
LSYFRHLAQQHIHIIMAGGQRLQLGDEICDMWMLISHAMPQLTNSLSEPSPCHDLVSANKRL